MITTQINRNNKIAEEQTEIEELYKTCQKKLSTPISQGADFTKENPFPGVLVNLIVEYLEIHAKSFSGKLRALCKHGADNIIIKLIDILGAKFFQSYKNCLPLYFPQGERLEALLSLAKSYKVPVPEGGNEALSFSTTPKTSGRNGKTPGCTP